MKVLYILHATIMGGATISFINMINGLKEKGIIPYIVIPKSCYDPDFIEYTHKNNIEVFSINLSSSYYTKPKNLLDFLRLCKHIPRVILNKIRGYYQLKRLCIKIKPDIIHTNVGVIHEGLYVAQKLNIPHVWHLREYQTLDFNLNIIPSLKYFCQLLKKSHVITITKDIKNYFGLNQHPHAHTIYNGIYSQKEQYYEYNKEKFFLCASRISPEKGHKDVIKTFAEYCNLHSEYKLYIAGFGEPTYIEELKTMATEYNCINNIHFLGFIKDMKPLMKKAKSLIVASYNEGFGRMTAEACFCGCIVIGRNTGGTKEILDETGGLQFSSNDELLQQMNYVSQLNDNEYKDIALAAQQKAVNTYSIENNIEQVYILYQSILFNK